MSASDCKGSPSRRPFGFYIEDEDLYYIEPTMVGTYLSYENYFVEEPKRHWWNRTKKVTAVEIQKPPFGFARALEDHES